MLNIHVERYWAERLSPLLDRHSFNIENRVSYESLFLSGSIAYSIQAWNKCVFINLARTWKPDMILCSQ